MIHTHKVRDTAGDATIWITETVNDDPDGTAAPHTRRTVWGVVQINALTVHVWVQETARMFNGASNRYTEHPASEVPDDHLAEMKRELKLDFVDKEKELDVLLRDFDVEFTAGGSHD